MTSTPQKPTSTIKRTFNAPIEKVWEAWTKPKHIAKWWAPQGMNLNIDLHDFKVGGQWKYSMEMPNGGQFVSEGCYIEIVDHEKIVTTADFKPMTEGVTMEMIFQSNGQTTEFTFNVIHPSEEYKLQQEEMGFQNGWGTVFNQLEEFLSSSEI